MTTAQTNYECGPKALFAAIKKHSLEFKMTYDEFLRYWRWPATGTYRDNMRDQPGDHLQVLRNLKILHRRVCLDESEPSTLNRVQNWFWLQLQKATKRISSWF